MMNQRELGSYYEERAKLRESVLTLEGLRECGITGLDEEIAGMEAAIREKAAELDAGADAVLSTLAQVRDTIGRTYCILHYHKGLTWKEIGAARNLSPDGARNRAVRAMEGIIPR